MTKYVLALSEEADQDLDNLYEEGIIKWGNAQADKYYDAILERFDVLCDTPYIYPAVDDIRQGYRRTVCGKHSIFYRLFGNTVEIMALVKYEDRYT